MIGLQISQNIKGSGDITMRRETKWTTKEDKHHSKKKINGASVSKSTQATEKENQE